MLIIHSQWREIIKHFMKGIQIIIKMKLSEIMSLLLGTEYYNFFEKFIISHVIVIQWRQWILVWLRSCNQEDLRLKPNSAWCSPSPPIPPPPYSHLLYLVIPRHTATQLSDTKFHKFYFSAKCLFIFLVPSLRKQVHARNR